MSWLVIPPGANARSLPGHSWIVTGWNPSLGGGIGDRLPGIPDCTAWNSLPRCRVGSETSGRRASIRSAISACASIRWNCRLRNVRPRRSPSATHGSAPRTIPRVSPPVAVDTSWKRSLTACIRKKPAPTSAEAQAQDCCACAGIGAREINHALKHQIAVRFMASSFLGSADLARKNPCWFLSTRLLRFRS